MRKCEICESEKGLIPFRGVNICQSGDCVKIYIKNIKGKKSSEKT
jgi:hypothetical protein